MACLLSRKACAEYLGVSLCTVRYWDVGRYRVPWAVVRLLRFKRLGDLGALESAWTGFVLDRRGLCTPDGRRFAPEVLKAWWLTVEQARFWRRDYDQRNATSHPSPAKPKSEQTRNRPRGLPSRPSRKQRKPKARR